MIVYIVTEGVYSDYHIEAVFTDRNQAELYVASHSNVYSEYIIEEWAVDEDKIEGDSVRYLYDFLLDGCMGLTEPHYVLKYDVNTRADYIRRMYRYPDLCYLIVLDERNDEKALKIAQDEYAKRKAIKKGVC